MGNRLKTDEEIRRLALYGNIGAEVVAEQFIDRYLAQWPTVDEGLTELDRLSRHLDGFADAEPQLATFLGRIEGYIESLRNGLSRRASLPALSEK